MPKRIQRKRTKGWRLPPGAVCVTRPGRFGNPFTTAEAFRNWLLFRAIPLMELRDEWIPWTPEKKEQLAERRDKILLGLPSLRGKKLACFCPLDHSCHADILLELANR